MHFASFLSVVAAVAGFACASATAHAQSDTAHHRKVYSAINESEGSMQKVKATHKDEPTVFALTGWIADGEVKKIVAECSDDGEGVTEYYLEDGKPLFVYNTYRQGGEGSKNRPKVEERLYFDKEGSIFKWLTTEKNAPVFHAEDYAATTELHTGNCKAFVAALKKKAAGKGNETAAEPSGNKSSAEGTVIVEGTFTGIEEGDYAHWQMRSKGGEEISYFILRPDASIEKVLENPKEYAGKKCRVITKKGMEEIPEAGGKLEIEQVLSVEWLRK